MREYLLKATGEINFFKKISIHYRDNTFLAFFNVENN